MSKSQVERRLEELEARARTRSRGSTIPTALRDHMLRRYEEHQARLAAMTSQDRAAEERRDEEALREMQRRYIQRFAH